MLSDSGGVRDNYIQVAAGQRASLWTCWRTGPAVLSPPLKSSGERMASPPRPLPVRPLVFPVTSEPLIPIKIRQVEGQAVKRRSN